MSVIKVDKIMDNSLMNKYHVTIFLLFLSIISFDGFDMVIYGATLPTIMETFKIDATEAGLVASYSLLGAAIGAFLFGMMANKIGRKKVIIIATLLFTLATFFTGMAGNIALFKVLRFITGLGLGGVMPNVVALSTEYSPAKNKAIIIAVIFSGMQIGGILASLISMWLLPHFGWNAVYFVGGIPLLLMPAYLKYIPESMSHLLKHGKSTEVGTILTKLEPTFKMEVDMKFQMTQQGEKVSISALFSEKKALSTVLIWIVYFMNMYMIFGLGTWLPKLMMISGLGLGSGLLFLLTLNLGALFGSNAAGLIADRIGYKKTLVALYLIAFCSILMLSTTSSFYVGICLVALAGIGFYGGQNVAHAYVGMFYHPSMRSTAMGFAFGVGRFGAIFGPMIAGFLVAQNVPLVMNFMVLAVPGLIAAVCVFAIQDKHGYAKNRE